MGFCVYTFPSTSFDAIELSLRTGGFNIERDETSQRKRLFAREGMARAQIGDATEKDSQARFVVITARRGLFSAIALWPIDRNLVRKIVRHLEEAGAHLVDFRNDENG
jgi:hypothetical protein